MKEIVTPQEREAILSQIRRKARREYLKVKDPSYSLLHVEEVVEHIKALAQEEELNVFIAAVTGWLHGLDWVSAEQIILLFEKQIPEEMRDSILEAIELHRLPVLPSVPGKTSKLSELLHDAYRGTKMGPPAILRKASALGIEIELTNEAEKAKQICEEGLLSALKSDPEKCSALIEYCDSVMEWYYGVKKDGELKVRPMKPAAKRRFGGDYTATAAYRIELLALQRGQNAHWY